MFQRSRNWVAETVWKPKSTHSLEKLKYLHFVLTKNSVVTDSNKSLLVETLRSIAEILIWGDQNDSSVFDFFLEKNMLLFFLKIMTQDSGTYVTVQLLQTLNILFENIRHETSLYFLLSNNHVNSIIVHKFDFSNEEVLAYYISFLKTLSLKLNQHTVNFYFNERKNDFPLYTEGIKFFNHPESMVRIAVRTLTLNIYKVGHEGMLNFICDKTADPYFSNMVWFIGKHAIELDDCVTKESDHLKCETLKMHVADHLDNLHYLHDILCLGIERLNVILTDHMLNKLLIPLYVYSLPPDDLDSKEKYIRIRISRLVSLFLLSQHLLIMNHGPLVSNLVDVILHDEDETQIQQFSSLDSPSTKHRVLSTPRGSPGVRAFIPPPDSLESQLEASGIIKDNYNLMQKLQYLSKDRKKKASTFYVTDGDLKRLEENSKEKAAEETKIPKYNSGSLDQSESEPESVTDVASQNASGTQTPQEHLQPAFTSSTSAIFEDQMKDFGPIRRSGPFLKNIYSAFDCTDGDCEALFAISFFYALLQNDGIDKQILKAAKISLPKESDEYSEELMEKLISILEQGARDGSKVRLVTLELAVVVLKQLAVNAGKSRLKDFHYAMIENVREASTFQLRNFYRADEVFLEMFECEYQQVLNKPINVQYVVMNASLLLPPTNTPLTGIEFNKRLPCGEEERARRAIRVFLLMRDLCLTIRNEPESKLPLNKVENPVKEEDVLDLNNSDLIACTVIVTTSRQHLRRFLVIDANQFILVEPDTSKLGWGVVKFVALLQDVEATPDKDDSRSLQIIVHRPFAAKNRQIVNPIPLLTARFVFDDYIRCMSARQRLQRRCATLRHRKMTTLANLLELPVMAAPPTHFYSLTPYNTGTQGYVWSPSSRGYTNRADDTGTGDSASKSNNLTPPRQAPQKSLPLSPKHSEILDQKTCGSRGKDATNKTSPSVFSPEAYVRPINLATALPRNEKAQRTQAESLASALGAKFGTDEIAAQELDAEMFCNLSEKVGRKLTVDEGEEMNEDCTDGTSDSEFFYDCKDNISASHSDLIRGLDRVEVKAPMDKPTKSAPSTPTGSRKIGIIGLIQGRVAQDDCLNVAKSLPAMALNFAENEVKEKQSTKRTKPAPETKATQKPRPTRPNRVNRSSKGKR